MAALSTTALAGPALAADIPIYEPPPAAEVVETLASWTGIYLGIAGGYGMTNDEVEAGLFTIDEGPFVGEFAETREVDGLAGDGALVEGTLGADLQIGSSFVIGALADVYWFDAEGEGFSAFANDAGEFGSITIATQREWGFDILGRVGFLANERALVYALGGYSSANIDVSVDQSFDNTFTEGGCGPCETSGSFDDHVNGWTVGGGIEAMITQALSVKAEYRYTEFEEIDGDVVEVAEDGEVFDIGDFSFDPSQQTSRVGLNYKFNGLFR